VARLNTEINAVLKSPELAQRWDALGVLPLGGTQAEAVARNQAETEKWSAVITAAKLQAE
jgi:tripartite-type tricarboxylate transporter receptor subunit TctC